MMSELWYIYSKKLPSDIQSSMAQSAARLTVNQKVASSSLAGRAYFFVFRLLVRFSIVFFTCFFVPSSPMRMPVCCFVFCFWAVLMITKGFVNEF